MALCVRGRKNAGNATLKEEVMTDRSLTVLAKNAINLEAEDVLPRVARECYKWLLCPTQDDPTAAKPTVEAVPLNTSGAALGSEIQRVCIDNEGVIGTWSPIHLRAKMQALYWKTDKPAFGAMAFWEDTLRYLYLPRLKSRAVLEQAIIKGAASRDFFGTAFAQTGTTFEGFKLGDSNVQLDDTLLLIEPEAAKRYEAAHSLPLPLVGSFGEGPPPPTDFGTTATSPGNGPSVLPAATTSVSPKVHTFIGTAEVSATTAKVRLMQIAEEIIGVLGACPGNELGTKQIEF